MRTYFSSGALLAGAIGLFGIAQAHSPIYADPSATGEAVARRFREAAANAVDAGLGAGTQAVALSVYDDIFKWKFSGTEYVVTVCFWNGSEAAQRAVVDSDDAWEGFANIRLDFGTPGGKLRRCSDAFSADIRISLDGADRRMDYDEYRPASGEWSYVARQAEDQHYRATVNLPHVQGLLELGKVAQANNYIRHELGHARGLLHEHQRAECRGWFDLDAIEADTHWSPATAEAAVAAFVDLPESGGFHPRTVGPYDRLSIMQYNFSPNWWRKRPGEVNPCFRSEFVDAPSDGDRATLTALYGAIPAVRTAKAAPPRRTFDQDLTMLVGALAANRQTLDKTVQAQGARSAIVALESAAAELSLLRRGQLQNATVVDAVQ